MKVNGVRMELGEIEEAIREQSGVKDVVVLTEEDDGTKMLIAYVVAERPGIDEGERLKRGVAATRPVYYVPREVRFIAAMPLTVSGKINRKVLAEQERLGTTKLLCLSRWRDIRTSRGDARALNHAINVGNLDKFSNGNRQICGSRTDTRQPANRVTSGCLYSSQQGGLTLGQKINL